MMNAVQEQASEKREAILNRATQFFADMGYDRASMSALAQFCKVSKGLIYHYFASKDEILNAILSSHLEVLRDAVLAVQESDPRQQLMRMIVTLLQLYEGADDAHKLQLGAMKLLSKQQQEYLKNIQREIVEAFTNTVIALDHHTVEMDRTRIRALVMSLFGMLNWRYLWHHEGKDLNAEQFAELCLKMVEGAIDQGKL